MDTYHINNKGLEMKLLNMIEKAATALANKTESMTNDLRIAAEERKTPEYIEMKKVERKVKIAERMKELESKHLALLAKRKKIAKKRKDLEELKEPKDTAKETKQTALSKLVEEYEVNGRLIGENGDYEVDEFIMDPRFPEEERTI